MNCDFFFFLFLFFYFLFSKTNQNQAENGEHVCEGEALLPRSEAESEAEAAGSSLLPQQDRKGAADIQEHGAALQEEAGGGGTCGCTRWEGFAQLFSTRRCW